MADAYASIQGSYLVNRQTSPMEQRIGRVLVLPVCKLDAFGREKEHAVIGYKELITGKLLVCCSPKKCEWGPVISPRFLNPAPLSPYDNSQYIGWKIDHVPLGQRMDEVGLNEYLQNSPEEILGYIHQLGEQAISVLASEGQLIVYNPNHNQADVSLRKVI